MAFTLKQALEFNKFTMSLAAAGLAYAATIGSAGLAGSAVSNWVKGLSTATIIAFAASILFGAFVMGRVAKLNVKDDAYVSRSQYEILRKSTLARASDWADFCWLAYAE